MKLYYLKSKNEFDNLNKKELEDHYKALQNLILKVKKVLHLKVFLVSRRSC